MHMIFALIPSLASTELTISAVATVILKLSLLT